MEECSLVSFFCSWLFMLVFCASSPFVWSQGGLNQAEINNDQIYTYIYFSCSQSLTWLIPTVGAEEGRRRKQEYTKTDLDWFKRLVLPHPSAKLAVCSH